MVSRKALFLLLAAVVTIVVSNIDAAPQDELDPYTLQQVFCRFPFAQVIPLEEGDNWGIIYADTYGKLRLLKATEKGLRVEWELSNLAAKVRKFFVRDVEGDGKIEVVVATVNGRILVYSMEEYQNTWENLDDRFESIAAMEVADVDTDPQLEFIVLADNYLHIFDGLSKSRQWVSERAFKASEIVIDNVDKDAQMEIILNSGVIIDTKFLNIELEWDKPFGERIMIFDMNNDGRPDIIGEFSDYSLRIFDVHARREVW